MNIINWQQFGLKSNPYDTLPLVEGGEIPIEQAFIGREKERDFLDSLLDSEKRLCLTICGNVGVGKTSLTNFQKFNWKYNKSKLLFSCRREIEANHDLLNKKNFLIEIMGSFLREIKLINPKLLGEELLTRINRIVDITQTLSLSAGISGGVAPYNLGVDFSKSNSVSNPVQMSVTALEEYFVELIKFIKTHEIGGNRYSGIIIHVNNFDVVLESEDDKKEVVKFFNEIRDLLQTPETYFLFLGPNNFFKEVIGKSTRVKSIFFQAPLMLNPLSKTELIQAFEGRMNLLKSDDVQEFIKPFEDDVIYKLYDIYSGDIRSIMSALRDILNQYSDKLASTLMLDEAMILLGREKWSRIHNLTQLTDEQKTVLSFIANASGLVTQKDISEKFKKAQTNISGYYFRPLKEAGIIEEKETKGKLKFWGLTQEYSPLKYSHEAQERMKGKIKIASEQLSLFT